MCQLWKARKADDVGTLTKTILITFQFDVTSIHIVEEFGSSIRNGPTETVVLIWLTSEGSAH